MATGNGNGRSEAASASGLTPRLAALKAVLPAPVTVNP